MAVTAYPFGTSVNMQVVWRDGQSNAIIDPANVRVRIVGPRGSPYHEYVYGIDSELIKVSAGVFRTTVVCDKDGPWSYRFECWGTHVGGNDRQFAIRDSTFYP